MNKRMDLDTIRTAALDLFRKEGYDQVTVDQLCKVLGITKPTFYKYVPGKEALLTSFYDALCNQIAGHFVDIYKLTSCRDQFHKIYDLIIDGSYQLGPQLIGKMLSLNLVNDQHSFELREPIANMILAIIEKGQQNGEFTSKLTAADLFDAVNFDFLGMEYKWSVKKGDFDWKAKFYTLTDILLEVSDQG
ncbi:MAG TPA: hypothetical protein DEP00_00065 [Lachnospiraceae bacterium]|nr:hypothetical protein [Lachnospiraceae bacterium]